MRKYFQMWGANKREFFVSIAVLLVGSIIMVVAMPPQSFESHTPRSYYANIGATRFALSLVFAVASLFCAINAWRDQGASAQEHKRIVIWSGALLLWICVLLALLLNWWLQLDDVLKMSWWRF